MLLFHDFGYLLAQYIGFGSVSAKKVNRYAVRPVLYFIFSCYTPPKGMKMG